MAKLQAPRGTYDALPEQSARFAMIENTARSVFGRYGFGEIRTPIFESADVFMRTAGESTDIVNKEMYLFEDRGGDQMALRPEGTAGVVRAYYSNGQKQNLPLKQFYVGTPMFRYERPQKGRFRQFHQIGAELFGIASPHADVEIIAMGIRLLKELGLTQKLVVKLNSLGTPEDRAAYRQKLLDYFEPVKDKLSADSRERLQTNPLRVLDSKEECDRQFVADAPRPLDYLSEASKAHFETVKAGLENLGVTYEIDTSLVRGLDYYTHTVFEVHGEGLGSQSQVIGGGRFDGLIEQMGGDSVPAVGFGLGMERLEMILEKQPEIQRPVAFIVMDEEGFAPCAKLAEELRAGGQAVYMPLEMPSFKAQMKKVNKTGASHAVIVGSEELASGNFQVKDLDEGTQETLTIAQIKEKFIK